MGKAKTEQERLANLTSQERIAIGYGIQDILGGHTTLWTTRIAKDFPNLYKYSIAKRKGV